MGSSARRGVEPLSAYEHGNQLARDGDLAGAEAEYRSADEQGHPRAAANLGLLLQAQGDIDGALAAYRRADEREDGLGALRLGLLLAELDDWDGAEPAYDRAHARGFEDDFDLAPLVEGRIHPADESAPATAPLSAFTNPVLIGAVTVLVVLVAVFLAYTANGGLPFVPTRELKVDIADGSNLVVGNDVLEGGHRIGFVSALAPVTLQNGTVGAQLTLKLDESQGKIPINSHVTIRLRVVLGSKYVDLAKGTSTRMFQDGGTLPISQTTVPVQLDQVFDIFNPPTRTAVQGNLVGFGDTFASRGGDLSDTIQSLPALLQYLTPVATYLQARNTQLIRFFNSLDDVTNALGPVSSDLVDLFGNSATTFQAIVSDPNAYERTIAESPSTLAVSTDSLRAQQPFLVDLTTFGGYLSPATASLKQALPNLNPALEAGTDTLARTPPLNARLEQVMEALKSLSLDPLTNVALNGLTSTVDTLNPMVKYLGPYQTVCDDWNYAWTYLSDTVSEPTTFGTSQRALLMTANPSQPNNPSTEPASGPQNGNTPASALTSPLGGNGYFHAPNYGAAIDNQGNADCETGQRGYALKENYFDPQHRDLDTDAHTVGDQGTTFAGLSRVPAGETYSREPTTGPQIPYNPSNP